MAIIVAAIVVFLSIKLNAFRDYQIAEIAVEVTAVAGLTVLTGLSGQISLGNGAFMAIGAYTTALLLLHLSWPFYARAGDRRRGHGRRRRGGGQSPRPGCAARTWRARPSCSASRSRRSPTPTRRPSAATRA